MDKNFFRFDIDDEVLSVNMANISSQTNKIEKKEPKKTANEDNFFCIRGSRKVLSASKKGYEKQSGLQTKKDINPNLFRVEDYINFDFRARNKKLENIEIKTEIISELSSQNSVEVVDEEVENVIEKAQIGVIFY